MNSEEWKRLTDRHLAINAVLEPIRDQLHDAVATAAERYIAVNRKYCKHTHFPRNLSSYWDWSIVGNEVNITWEEYWSYGGHDEGTFTFDVAFVHDEEMFTKLEAELAARKEGVTQRVEAAEKRTRRLQYEKLKAEFGA